MQLKNKTVNQHRNQAMNTTSTVLLNRFTPTQGTGGRLAAFAGTEVCTKDSYHPSDLEIGFTQHANVWTSSQPALCGHLANKEWVTENLAGNAVASPTFSRMCRRGEHSQVLEPLAGILRDPRFLCPSSTWNLLFSIDWLVLADDKSLRLAPDAKRYFFDAGGTRFMDAMHFFTSKYQDRGIVFDHIYVWEAVYQSVEKYWEGTPPAARAFWEPRLSFFNGVPVTADPTDKINNPVNRIFELCRVQDFCAFKLDIDTPSVELPIVKQLLRQPVATRASLNEFFFEHHVHGLMQAQGWGWKVEGTFADSYELFAQLRRMGVRAHSWI